MGQTLEKLSSGLKINRAAEGPATLVISEHMRGQISSMNQAIDNSETAISMVQTTESNLVEVNRLLVGIRQLAIHASNEGSNSTAMLEADQSEIDHALASIDRIAKQARFGNKKLLDGTNGISGNTTGEGLSFLSAGLNTQDSSKKGYAVVVTQQATRSRVEGTVALSPEMIGKGETLTVIEKGKMASYTTSADDTLDRVVKNLANETRQQGLRLDVRLTDLGTFEIVHQDFGSDMNFQVSSSTAGVLSAKAGEIQANTPGLDIKGSINGEPAKGYGEVLTGMAGSVADLQVRYVHQGEAIPPEGLGVGRVYITQNSLKFQVGGSYGQTVGMNVKNISSHALGVGVDNESGFRSLADLDVRSFQGAQDTLFLVDQAIHDVTRIRSDLGAFQKNALEGNLQNLRIANENLVSSESVLRDADMAGETASFTRNQIMSESATAMLAQANQTPKTVLRLIG